MTGEEAARLLRERAAAYGRDAEALWHLGEKDAALNYRAMATELEKCAREVEE